MEDTSQFNEDFIKSYDEESEKWYFLEIDVHYNEKLHELNNELLFLPERMKNVKVENPVATLQNKPEYVICIWNLRQALALRTCSSIWNL